MPRIILRPTLTLAGRRNMIGGIATTKPWNRKSDLEVLFILCLMLHFPPILAGV